jgi:lipopolysaccharide/colanic/teichoic acid biosynthesis glycosyltransferase
MFEAYQLFKRNIDVLLSLMALVVLSPLFILLSILIYFSSPGNIYYRQIRVGKEGVHYQMYKFRSMYQNSEKNTGPIWASREDKRITPIGRVMRKFHLDEIPQFFNVLIGDMSIVGPRPERPEIVKNIMEEIPDYLNRTKIKPGITGWAQVQGVYDKNLDDVSLKLKKDCYYIENCSIAFDIKILFLTLMKIIKGQGV